MQFQLGVTRAPGSILFGCGQRRALGRTAAEIGSRALICTDKRFAGLDVMKEMLSDLQAYGIVHEVFDGTQAELPLQSILQCVDEYRAFKPDMVIGLGGGSCLDMAKLVSLLLTHGGPIDQYYGEFKVPGPILPVIAVPTTSGTGSEVTPVAVLGDSNREIKVGISSPRLIPHTAICDPELTLTCPQMLTAISGADALTHAIEAFTAVRRAPAADLAYTRVFVGKNALSDQHALAAIRLIYENLPTAVANGDDVEARSALMLGSTLAGLAFGSAGTSAAHAIQYPVGALTHTAHGLGVGVILPHAMSFNAPACAEEYAQIGKAIGVSEPDMDTGQQADAAISAIRQLFVQIGIPETLADLGIKAEQLEWIAEKSLLAARLVENNPRPLDRSAAKTILDNAFYGAAQRPERLNALQEA